MPQKKPLFIDASFERNTRAYQRDQLQNKVRSLTLGEVSREIHMLKSEISALKFQVSQLEKGKQVMAQNVLGHYTNYTLHNTPNVESKVEIVEGKKDPTVGFREMRVLAIEYQQHHVQVNICIKGEMFSLTTLLDSGADVNIFSKKAITSKYWVSASRKIIGSGEEKV